MLFKDTREEKFQTVFITFKNRLTRFGYRYLKDYLNRMRTQIRF